MDRDCRAISSRQSFLLKAAGCALFILLLAFGCAPKAVRVTEPLSEKRTAIVRSALSFQGRVYKSGAKGPDAFDCSGFVHYIYKKSGILLPVTAADLSRTGIEVPREAALPGDLIFFKIKWDLHVGIVLSNDLFIHASSSRGVVVDSLSLPYWNRSLYGFRSTL